MSYSSVVLSDSPLAYWRLGEPSGAAVARDDSGHARHGTVSGGGVTFGTASGFAGVSGRGATFNGSSGNIAIADADLVGLPSGNAPFTLEALIKVAGTGAGGFGTIFGYGEDNAGGSLTYGHYNGLLVQGTDTLYWNGYGDDYSVNVGSLTGVWHHVATTWDGTTLTLYKDGASVGASTAVTVGTQLAHGYIGRRNLTWDDDNLFWNGALDEVAVYGTCLSATRLAAHYTAAGVALPAFTGESYGYGHLLPAFASHVVNTGPQDAYDAAVLADAPLAYWPMSETHGDYVHDLTNNGHDGWLGGTPGLDIGAWGPRGNPAVYFSDTGRNDVDMGIPIQNPQTLPLTLSAMTVEAWLAPIIPVIGAPYSSSNEWFEAVLFWGDVTGNNYYFIADLGVHRAGGAKIVRYPEIYEGYSGFCAPNDPTSALDWNAHEWHHLVWTWSQPAGHPWDGEGTIYLDGAAWNTGGTNFGNFSDQTPFVAAVAWLGAAGAAVDSWRERWTGGMSHVALYDHALSAGRVAAHFAALPTVTYERRLYGGVSLAPDQYGRRLSLYGRTVIADNPVCYWPLDDQEPVARDLSPRAGYDLRPPPDPRPGVEGPFLQAAATPYDPAGWGSTYYYVAAFGHDTSQMLDGNLSTYYDSYYNQTAGYYVQVDMRVARSVGYVTLDNTALGGYYPLTDVTIQLSLDGTAWTTISARQTLGPLTTLFFVTRYTARYIRVSLTAGSGTVWRVGEFNVYPLISASSAVRFRKGGAIVGDQAVLPTSGTFTLECWVRDDDDGASPPAGLCLAYGDPAGAAGQVRLSVIAGASSQVVVGWRTPGGANTAHADGCASLGGAWHHVAATYNGTSLRTYRDGTLIATTALSITLAAPAAGRFWLGGVPGGSALWGDIAYGAVYGSALSGGRIAAHAACVTDAAYRTAVLTDNPLAFWPLQEGV